MRNRFAIRLQPQVFLITLGQVFILAECPLPIVESAFENTNLLTCNLSLHAHGSLGVGLHSISLIRPVIFAFVISPLLLGVISLCSSILQSSLWPPLLTQHAMENDSVLVLERTKQLGDLDIELIDWHPQR